MVSSGQASDSPSAAARSCLHGGAGSITGTVRPRPLAGRRGVPSRRNGGAPNPTDSGLLRTCPGYADPFYIRTSQRKVRNSVLLGPPEEDRTTPHAIAVIRITGPPAKFQ